MISPRTALAIFLIVAFTAAPQGTKAQDWHSLSGRESLNPQIHAEKNPRIPLVPPFWEDLGYVTTHRDFYLLVAGLSLTPEVFDKGFDTEDPEITEHWGQSRFATEIFGPGNIAGNALVHFSASLLSIGIGRVAHSSKLQEFGSDLFRVQVINGAITGLMKVSIDRTRPNGAPYSYPSGHSSVSFATAAVVSSNFGWKWGIPAFGVASYVALSRLQQDKHYTSDVIVGGVLGTYIGFRLSNWHKQSSHFRIAPSYSGTGPGIGMSYSF